MLGKRLSFPKINKDLYLKRKIEKRKWEIIKVLFTVT